MKSKNKLDGLQRMSRWPNNIVDYVSKNVKRNCILVQSKHSRHRLLAERVKTADVVIGYNPDAEYFVAWSAPINAIQNTDERGDVHFVFKNSSHIAAEDKISFTFDSTGAYRDINSGKVYPHVYQKICVFSEDNFIEFYENYEKYLLPNSKDAGYKTPVFNSNGGQVIE